MKLFVLLLVFSGMASAEIYKCKDANGKTTYQSEPCASDEGNYSNKFILKRDISMVDQAKAQAKFEQDLAGIKERKSIATKEADKQLLIRVEDGKSKAAGIKHKF